MSEIKETYIHPDAYGIPGINDPVSRLKRTSQASATVKPVAQATAERQELHKTIWSIAEDLRGNLDGWDFKNYVLSTMFYRYLSEDIANEINTVEREAGDEKFDYALLSDEDAEQLRDDIMQVKGYFLLPSQLFCNVRAQASEDENLNTTLESIFRSIEQSSYGTPSEKCFRDVFSDFDLQSNKLGQTVASRNKKLVKLLNGIANMNLGDIRDHNNDTFGDAYEYLMGMYAANAGKSGGEYFTPSEVSTLLTRLGTVGKTMVNKVYDPTCGSGSLLLKARSVLGPNGVRIGYYGQENQPTTYNLCRLNMFLHGVEFDKFDIACEDTLLHPQHWDDEPFELIVSNPPYSIKWVGSDDATLINDPRFAPAGVLAPKSKADLAFVMHSLSWLSNNGVAAIVCFPGMLYRGGAEQKIRQYLIDNNFVDAIIQLPENLFYGTSIATCILVLKKGKADNTVSFIDATKECVKVTNSNKLTPENIDAIVDMFANHENVAHKVAVVPANEIQSKDYNLSVSTYVEAEDIREKIDIAKLNAEIADIVARENVLRAEIDKIIAEIEVQ